MGAGASLFGALSDRKIGRRNAVLLSMLLSTIGAAAAASVHSIEAVLAPLILIGAGVGGTLPVVSSLFAEQNMESGNNVPKEERGFWLTLLGASFGVGAIPSALGLAYPLLAYGEATFGLAGWRCLLLGCAATEGAVLVLLACTLPESVKWQRLDKAAAAAAASSARIPISINATDPDPGTGNDDARTALIAKEPAARAGASKASAGFGELLSPALRRASLLLWIIWGGFNFAISGFTAFLPQLLDSSSNATGCGAPGNANASSCDPAAWWRQSKQVAVYSTVAVPGVLIAAAVIGHHDRSMKRTRKQQRQLGGASRLVSTGAGRAATDSSNCYSTPGRRFMLAVSVLLTAAATGLFAVRGSSPAELLLLGCASSLFSNCAWAVLYTATPELYPTRVRATGFGAAHVAHSIAGVLGPLTGGFFLSGNGNSTNTTNVNGNGNSTESHVGGVGDGRVGSGTSASVTRGSKNAVAVLIFATACAVAGAAAIFLPAPTHHEDEDEDKSEDEDAPGNAAASSAASEARTNTRTSNGGSTAANIYEDDVFVVDATHQFVVGGVAKAPAVPVLIRERDGTGIGNETRMVASPQERAGVPANAALPTQLRNPSAGLPLLATLTRASLPFASAATLHATTSVAATGTAADSGAVAPDPTPLLAACGKAARSLLDQRLATAPVLLHGMPVKTASDFNTFVTAMGYPSMDTMGASSRDRKAANVFGASDDVPASHTLHPHNEQAYLGAQETPSFPRKIFFCCTQLAEHGGETPFLLNSELTARLRPDVLAKFRQHGVRYRQLLPSGASRTGSLLRDEDGNLIENLGGKQTWQALFECTSAAEAEEKAKARGYECRWEDGGSGEGEGGSETAAGLSAQRGGPLTILSETRNAFRHGSFWNQASNVFSFVPCWGDAEGTPIEDDVLEHLNAAMWDSTIAFQWTEGDVLCCDNERAMHARTSFKSFPGARRQILVGLSSI